MWRETDFSFLPALFSVLRAPSYAVDLINLRVWVSWTKTRPSAAREFRRLCAECVVRSLGAVLRVVLAVGVTVAVGRLSGLTLNSCKALV